MEKLLKKWENCQLMKIFEVEVIDRRDGRKTYVTFDIDIENNQFVASHEALTIKQEQSNQIASIKRDIDPDFSLDENLQELYEDCSAAIDSSDCYLYIFK